MVEVEKELQELEKLKQEAKRLEDEIKKSVPHLQNKENEIDEAIKRLQEEKNHLLAEKRSSAAFLYEKLDKTSIKVDSRIARIKRLIQQIPARDSSEGRSISTDGAQVSVSKVGVKVTYDASILGEHPWMMVHEVDGMPLVNQVINPEVMGLVVARGDISREEAEKFAIYTKSRNPSVRITFKDKK